MKVISPNKNKLEDMTLVSASVIDSQSHPHPNNTTTTTNPTPPSQPMPSTGRRPSASCHTTTSTSKPRYLTFESDPVPEDVKVSSPSIIAMNSLHSVITLRPLQGKCTDQGKPSPPKPIAGGSRKMRGRSSLLMCSGEGSCLVLNSDPSAEQEQLLLLTSPSTPSLFPLSPPSRSEDELMKGFFKLGTSLFSSSSSCVEEEPSKVQPQPAFTILKEVPLEETLPSIQAYREAISSRPSSSFDGFPHILPVIDVLNRSASPPTGTRSSIIIFDDSPLPSPKHADDKEEKGKKLLVELHLPRKPSFPISIGEATRLE